MKKYLYILIFILLLIVTSCQQQQEKEKSDSSSSPDFQAQMALKEFQLLSKNLLGSIEKKDYITASKSIFKLNENWNNFYPHAFKAGIKSDITDNFVKDLNNLSTKILMYSNQEKNKKLDIEIQKSDLQIKQFLNTKESIIKPQTEQKQSSSDKSSSDKGNSSDKKDQKGSSSTTTKNENSFKNIDKNIKLPEELKSTTYPEISLAEKDADAFISAAQLTKHISKFYAIFNKHKESELILIKYYLQNIRGNALLNNWVTIKDDIKNANESWLNVQSLLKEKNDSTIQITQNLTEIEDLSLQKNDIMIDLKCQIAIKNIDLMLEK